MASAKYSAVVHVYNTAKKEPCCNVDENIIEQCFAVTVVTPEVFVRVLR